MYIDIHCHLDYYKDEEIEEIVKQCIKDNVLIVTTGVNPKANRRVMEIVNSYSQVKASLGMYPIDSLSLSDEEIEREHDFIFDNSDKIIAIGEVGMDFKESTSKEEHKKQEEIFEDIIELAKEIDKPLIIHSRKAEKECIEILEKHKAKKVIMHCFNGNFSLIKRVIENGWYLTVPTSVTRSEHFQKVAKEIPLDKLFCETDSPFLHPFKERNNKPYLVIESYKKIAEIKGISLKKVEEQIENNFENVFGTRI